MAMTRMDLLFRGFNNSEIIMKKGELKITITTHESGKFEAKIVNNQREVFKSVFFNEGVTKDMVITAIRAISIEPPQAWEDKGEMR